MIAVAPTSAPLAERECSTAELAPRPRPQCKSCGAFAPTIDGHCVAHMTLATEIALHVVSPADLGLAGK